MVYSRIMHNEELKNSFSGSAEHEDLQKNAGLSSSLSALSRVSQNFATAAALIVSVGLPLDATALEGRFETNYTMHDKPRIKNFKCSRNSIERETFYVVRPDTGEVMADHGGDLTVQPASMTKLMTLLLAAEAVRDGWSLREPLYFSKEQKADRDYIDRFTNRSYLRVGEAMELAAEHSSNDAAFLLLENIAKFRGVGNTETHGLKLMNDRAKELGMEHTLFPNSNGMPDLLVAGQKSGTTTKDMTILMREIIENAPELHEILRLKTMDAYDSFERNEKKTGVTCASGFVITMHSVQDDVPLIISYVGGKRSYDREARVSDILQSVFDDIAEEKREAQMLLEREQAEILENLF